MPPPSAIYVDPVGGDDMALGTQSDPKQTIGAALKQSATSGEEAVILAKGVYPGAVTVEGATVELLGGWTPNQFIGWRRECPRSRLETELRSVDGGPALVVLDGGGVKVESMVLASLVGGVTPADTSGESRYGVVVRGSRLELVDVTVRVAGGLPGGVATSGAAQGVRTNCDGGPAVCQNGAEAIPVTSLRADGGGLGTFSAAGYAPANGLAGSSGNDGFNGVGAPLPPMQNGCTDACSCAVNSCNSQPVSTVTSGRGTCGCGGRGGTGGAPGRGGGASVGLFAHRSALTLNGVLLETGTGGSGSPGGGGGAGTLGTDGGFGQNALCYTQACRVVNGTCPNAGCYRGEAPDNQPTITVPGGQPGSPGGRGGVGQAGGGGSGGPSVGLVTIGSTLAPDAGITTRPGAGGLGAAGASDGQSVGALIFL